MHIKPCFRCSQRTACPIRLKKLEQISGAGLTSIKFNCDLYWKQFASGDRVMAIIGTGDNKFDALGTVMIFTRYKVQICLDDEFVADVVWVQPDDIQQPDETISHAVIKVWPDRLTKTGEKVPLCEQCRKPMHCTVEGWTCEYRIGDATGPCRAGDPDVYHKRKMAELNSVAESLVW